MIAGSSLFFSMIHIKYVVFMSLWSRTIRSLISNWSRTRKFSQFFNTTGGEDPFTRRSFQEETGIVLAFLRRRIALWSLKRMPVMADYHVIDFRQIHWLRGKISLTFCREQKTAFLSVGSANVVVFLPLWEMDNYFGRNVWWYVSSRG